MTLVPCSVPVRAFALAALMAVTFLSAAAPASAQAPGPDEFTAKASDYETPFTEASAAIKQIILDEGFAVVGVADFTDLAGQPLQIGRLYAEEFATRLVGPRKKYRLLDPATLLGLVEASGGTSLWATPEKIRQFGKQSKVELVVTGRIEIAAKEARFFIKAIATDDAGVVWAKTIAVPGVSAAAAEEAAKAEAEALAAQTKLVAQPIASDATSSDALAITVGSMFGEQTTPSAAPASAGAVTTNPAAPPATVAATPTIGAIVAAPVPTASAPAASVTTASAPAATSNPPAPSAPAATTTAAPAPAATQAAAPAPSPKPAAPQVSAPVGGAAVAAGAAVTAAAASAAAAPAPKPAPVQAAPAPPPEVLTFENAWLRARVRSASKYEGSGWVTAVLDLTNLSDRPIKLDAAQDDPGKGVDELGNNWRIERVSGLKLASGAAAVNTTLNPSSTVSVVVVLATSANPSGRRLSFGPNIYWFGSPASGDSGRVAVAFSNIRVN
jgi:hypothetical protein